MSIDLELYESLYFPTDEPIPYNLKDGTTIMINPIMTNDYPTYEFCSMILKIPKNEIGEMAYITMSYLEFLITLFKSDNTYSKRLVNILSLTIKEEVYSFAIENNRPYLKVIDEYGEVKHTIDKKEFDEIIKIIQYQNEIDYDDDYISPDMRNAIEEYYRLKYRDTISPSFEKQRAFVISRTGITPSQLKDMTYRTFSQVYKASVDSEMYMAQKIIQASEKYEVKEDVIHPLFEKKKDKYSDVFQDADTFKKKVESGANGM